MVELILGGVRSGKSREAQRRAIGTGFAVTYVATATRSDDEMVKRIERHRADRPEGWRTIEEPYYLADRLISESRPDHCLIVDCLTLWLSNWLLKGTEGYADFIEERDKLLDALGELPGYTILVSNETNQGVIPASALSRQFCDEAGLLHQAIAAISDRVSLMVAGIPTDIKKKGDQ